MTRTFSAPAVVAGWRRRVRMASGSSRATRNGWSNGTNGDDTEGPVPVRGRSERTEIAMAVHGRPVFSAIQKAHAGEVNHSVSRASQARSTPEMRDGGAMWEQMSRGLCDVRIGQRCVI